MVTITESSCNKKMLSFKFTFFHPSTNYSRQLQMGKR